MSPEIRTALDAFDAGRLDALTPNTIARLEEHLRDDPAAAAHVAELRPPCEPVWQAGVPMPSAQTWDRVWQHIGRQAAKAEPRRRALRTLRLWAPLAAVAAVILLAALWSLDRDASAPAWPIEWARHVEIDELEVADGATPLVVAGEGDHSISVIWVLDEQS